MQQETLKKRRRIPRTTWENFDHNDFCQAFIGDRDTDGDWIRCSICDVELSCGQFFRYRLVRLSSHNDAVHTRDRLQSTKSQKLHKWLTFSPQSQIQLASNDTEVAVLLCHRTRGIKASRVFWTVILNHNHCNRCVCGVSDYSSFRIHCLFNVVHSSEFVSIAFQARGRSFELQS